MDFCVSCGFCFSGVLLSLIILDRSLDRVFGQHRTMKLDRGQLQMSCNFCVLYFDRIVNCHSFENLSGIRGRGDCGSTSKRLENGFLNGAVCLVDLDLEFHNITTGRGSYQAGTDIDVFLVEGANSWVHAATMAAARCAGFSPLKMPLPTKTPSQPSSMSRPTSAGVARPPAAKVTTGRRPASRTCSTSSTGTWSSLA